MAFEEPTDFWKRWLRSEKQQKIAMLSGISEAIESQIENLTTIECEPTMRRKVLNNLLNDYFEELAAALKKAR